jgi:pimeloyl-ACP methyl ester carboxylesterase/lysophospholipase L1-like esterase
MDNGLGEIEMRIQYCLLILLLVACSAVNAADFPGTKSTWQGFDRYVFSVAGRRCWVVTPQAQAEGRPWIWRARFFGHEPQADIALLKEGFHLAYCDVGGLYGSPQAVKHWNAFYELLTEKHGLARRPALEGMSRGGLIIYNWAAANPGKVACIYGDAPVCDFKSWPGGKGKGKGSPGSWMQCLEAYGMTEAEGLAYRGNPVDRLRSLAEARVPLLHVVGDADEVVPVEENTAIIEARYKELGGSIQVIHKPGVGHHPHSLKDPAPIVTFVLKHTRANVQQRGSLDNSRIRFEKERKGHVAFIGGSITEMNGYRPMVCESLRKRFPETEFTFTTAGISSTCSTSGAFRLATDVLSRGPVDMFFIEFAVNDDQDAGHSRQECIRGMEGIIRQSRRHNPGVDIVITHFVNPGMLKQLQAGTTPLSMRAHADVAGHYGVSTIHLAKEVSERIGSGALSWEEFGGTHPKPAGNRICTDMIDQLLDGAWNETLPDDARPVAHALPREPLDPLHYGNGRFVDPKQASLKAGWQIGTPDWKALPGGKRMRFTSMPMLTAEKAGAELTLQFSGTAVGAYVVAGPDAGILEARVDDGDFKPVNLYHRFSKGLHYPRTVMFGTGLPPGEHVLTLRVSAETESSGHAARIMMFVAN